MVRSNLLEKVSGHFVHLSYEYWAVLGVVSRRGKALTNIWGYFVACFRAVVVVREALQRPLAPMTGDSQTARVVILLFMSLLVPSSIVT
jgi:hypothetical protein